MDNPGKLINPWLVAVWPGMGHVSTSAGFYLLAKLEMHILAEFAARELFEVDHVDVRGGLVHTGRLPRSRLFVWTDPHHKHDILVLIGEAQPPLGKYAFCRRLIDYARELGVERVFTFAALASNMQPTDRSRVFGVATDEASLGKLRQLEVGILEDGQISGLNGVLLGVAEEVGLRGSCLLGEIPSVLRQLPFPKASLAILEVFTTLAGIDLDLVELAEQARRFEHDLDELLKGLKQVVNPDQMEEPEEAPEEDAGITAEQVQRIETLFATAQRDRSRTYELKRELDRLNVFDQYEDRFLDLFKKRE